VHHARDAEVAGNHEMRNGASRNVEFRHVRRRDAGQLGVCDLTLLALGAYRRQRVPQRARNTATRPPPNARTTPAMPMAIEIDARPAVCGRLAPRGSAQERERERVGPLNADARARVSMRLPRALAFAPERARRR
jgi:hypothetical protein